MEERLKALEGITATEWLRLKIVVDNRFLDIQKNSTFTINEDTVNELKAIL